LVTHYNAILDHITPEQVHVMNGGRLVKSGGQELVKEIAVSGFTPYIESN
jgi:Fe-S cluster assembly ATP-binding protein